MIRYEDPPKYSLLVAVFVLLAIIQTTRILYIAFVGPYSKYPGPKLAKVTRLPLLWHKLRGHETNWTTALHMKYGDIVQTAPNQISFASGHAWKDICGFTTGGKSQHFPKDPVFYGNRPVGVADIIYSNEADHTRMRRNLSHAFSDRALREQLPLIRKYIDQLVSGLQKKGSEKLDIVKWYNFCTFDIMGDLTFGEPLGCLSTGEYTPWVAMIFQSVKVNAYLTEMRHFPLLKPLIRSSIPKGSQEQRAEHWALSAERVNKRIEKVDARPDIWGFVLNAKEQQQLTIPEMHSTAQILMLAGTETTATLLSGLTYHLLMNPEKMERVKEEIRKTFNSADDIDIDSILRLKYVNACFEEALRCYPPVPTALPRVVPKGGDYICGQYIPGGTSVGVHQYSTYHSPNNFRRPMEFLPERWLGDPEFDHDHKAALQPFSYGPRNCIGKNLAYLEMRMIFSNIMWHFDINLCEESARWTDQKSYNLWEKNPLTVTLQPVIREK